MSKPLRITLFALGGIASLVAAVMIAALLFFDAGSFKPRLEALASSMLGMDVAIDGRVGIGLLPGLNVTLEELHLRKEGVDVASATSVRLGIALLPLLTKRVQIDSVSLVQPTTFIERDLDGRFNVEKLAVKEALLAALNLPSVSLSDWTLRYVDRRSGTSLEADGCNLDVEGPRVESGQRSELMRNVSLEAELACREVRAQTLTVIDLELSVEGKDGIFDIEPVTMKLLGGNGSGRIRGDFSGDVPRFDIDYALPQFRVDEFFTVRALPERATGAMDFAAKLSLRGSSVAELRQTIEGQITLRGEHITLHGIDLDEDIERFESSQNFNLVDVGAFFLVGPFGLVATKAYDFASIFRSSEGDSEIEQLVSDWTVKGGRAEAQDVALATRKYRIALQGTLDLVDDRFDGVTIAIVDRDGCAEVRQGIQGPFQNPTVEAASVFRSMMGPAIGLLRKGRDLFPAGECDVFYAGSVAAPE